MTHKTAQLVRHSLRADATLGALEFGDGATFATLELPWRNNAESLSCIPAGRYLCKMVDSPRFGRVYEITDVPGRSHILFHAGNYPRDTHGCVLIGRQHAVVDGKSTLSASRAGLQAMHAHTGGEDFWLEIPQ